MKHITRSSCILMLFALSSGVFAKPDIQRIIAFRDTVGMYEKYETRMQLNATFENPFDPDQIDITAVFTSPSDKQWKMFAFYDNSWFPWVLRFSPNETGQWSFVVTVRDKKSSVRCEKQSFTVIPSKHHGPIRVAANKRYLEHADGTSFYGVGLWYNGALRGFRPDRLGPADVLDELRNLGANFISTILPPIETIGTGVGRYDQNICSKMDDLLGWLEERDMYLSLNLWFHSYLSETVWQGWNRQWHTNPYQYVCPVKEFYSHKKAWSYQEKLYRYMIARWSYSRALAIWFVVDEVNGTDGWAYGDSLGAAKWGKKVHDFLKKNDPYGHLTTGTRSGGFREWWHEGYQIFDLASREIYEAQGFPILDDGKIDPGDANPLRLSYMNYITEIRKLWHGYEKPAIIGETGWDHVFYEPSMPGYLALYHNAVWASLSTGLAMTPFWWSYSRIVNDNVVTQQMASVARFTSGIPLAELANLTPVEATLSNGDAFAMKSDQLIFGWVVNPDTDVSGAVISLSSLAGGSYTVQLFHTWRGEFFHEENVTIADGNLEFTIPVLKIDDSHARYVGQDVAFIVKPAR